MRFAMQMVEFDSDKGKIYVNPTQVVKIVQVATDASASEVYLVTVMDNARVVVKCSAKKAAEEINRCLK
jgi:hypothetical protein